MLLGTGWRYIFERYLPINENVNLYAFGGYTYRNGESAANFHASLIMQTIFPMSIPKDFCR